MALDVDGLPAVRAATSTLRVLVGSWEVGCCVDPPAVGAAVQWPLRFVEADGPAEQVQELDGAAVPLGPWEGATLGTSRTRLLCG